MILFYLQLHIILVSAWAFHIPIRYNKGLLSSSSSSSSSSVPFHRRHSSRLVKSLQSTTITTPARVRRVRRYGTPKNDETPIEPELLTKQDPTNNSNKINNNDDDDDNIPLDWLPDREKARILQENRWKSARADDVGEEKKDKGGTKKKKIRPKQQQVKVSKERSTLQSKIGSKNSSSGDNSRKTSSRKTSSRNSKNSSNNIVDSNDVTKDSNGNSNSNNSSSNSSNTKKKKSVYSDEEEELIEILGGKDFDSPSRKRESGFLGDCTLKEISMDYQVPMCYLADVLCGWGVPPPIDPDGLLGDMVTGEQAFAILEAIHTLDMGALYDRYANYDLVTLCSEYDIPLPDAFEMAMKEGWNLPFGVRTYLRVEQEERLLEALAKDVW